MLFVGSVRLNIIKEDQLLAVSRLYLRLVQAVVGLRRSHITSPGVASPGVASPGVTAPGVALLAMAMLLAGCQAPPPRNSEEYLFNRWLDDQRQQCRQLPEPLSSSCLQDSAKRNYQDFVRQRQQNQQQR